MGMSLLYANFDDFSSNTMKSGSDFLSKVRPAKKEVKADLMTGNFLHTVPETFLANHLSFGNCFTATYTAVNANDVFPVIFR